MCSVSKYAKDVNIPMTTRLCTVHIANSNSFIPGLFSFILIILDSVFGGINSRPNQGMIICFSKPASEARPTQSKVSHQKSHRECPPPQAPLFPVSRCQPYFLSSGHIPAGLPPHLEHHSQTQASGRLSLPFLFLSPPTSCSRLTVLLASLRPARCTIFRGLLLNCSVSCITTYITILLLFSTPNMVVFFSSTWKPYSTTSTLPML